MKKFKFSIDNNPFEVNVTELENGQIDVEVNGSNYIVTIDREGTKAANAPAKAAPKAAAPAAAPKAAPAAAPKAAAAPAAPAAPATGAVKTVKSQLPGSVTKLIAEVGQAVKKGDTVMMIEAMKMENEIKAECDGTIAQFYVEPGKSVMADDKLFDIACGGATAAPKAAAPVAAPAPKPVPAPAPAAAPAAGGPAKPLKSPLPGSITKILVTPGQAVKRGETVMMMEAMKMENEIKAEKDGVVAEIKVAVGQNVMNDEVLLTIA